MDWQSAFNIAMAIIAALGGILLKWLGDSLKSLRTTNETMAEKIQHIELLVAGQYAKKDDLEKSSAVYKEGLDKLSISIFAKLDRIENKLDQKVDK